MIVDQSISVKFVPPPINWLLTVLPYDELKRLWKQKLRQGQIWSFTEIWDVWTVRAYKYCIRIDLKSKCQLYY